MCYVGDSFFFKFYAEELKFCLDNSPIVYSFKYRHLLLNGET